MARYPVLTCLVLLLSAPVAAHGWFSDYTTGRQKFEECCGYQDCHTAKSLGYPEIRKRNDGGYNVRLGGGWIKYDFPAVHASHDSHTWICYMGDAADQPDPLCLFLPAGIM